MYNLIFNKPVYADSFTFLFSRTRYQELEKIIRKQQLYMSGENVHAYTKYSCSLNLIRRLRCNPGVSSIFQY